ncbi:MAG: HlyD family efflux transporter periplasmic adaptor subunit [Lachnospiraceae bacterium]|nr:HlyD family efflux transporter periplasmic adaptor subunit [Lachnospiraceae bacterium]
MKKILITAMIMMTVVFAGCGKGESISKSLIVTPEAGRYMEKFSADGTVECREPRYIYSTQALPVKEVLVKEGDHVEPGTLLCVLDTKEIEENIAVKQTSLELNGKLADTGVTEAQDKYDVYREGLANGTDVSLVTSKANMENAREAYEKAQKAYDDYKDALGLGLDPSLVAADQQVAKAATSLQQAKSMQEKLDDEKDITKIQKEEAEDVSDSASLAYVQAVQNRNVLLKQSDIKLSDLAKQAEDANYDYIMAQTSYASAVRALENAKKLSGDALEKAKLAGDMSVGEMELTNLKEKLNDAQIVAGCSGTVTAINAKTGETSTGVLFVIEDTSDLVVTAKVSEKEINSVSEGMAVMVETKSNNSESYTGIVEKTAESAIKTAEGETDTSGKDAEYNVRVSLDAPDSDIRIGMNTKTQFVVFEQEECINVPNEAVYSEEDGKKYILTISSDTEKGTIEKKEVNVVFKGKRNSVIEGSGISSGIHVLADAGTYMDMTGATVAISE